MNLMSLKQGGQTVALAEEPTPLPVIQTKHTSNGTRVGTHHREGECIGVYCQESTHQAFDLDWTLQSIIELLHD